jgi:hypothetical protein
MGFIAEGGFTQGWNLISGEPLPSDLAQLGLEIEAPPAEYKRGPWSPRFRRDADLPAAEVAEVARQAQKVVSAATVYNTLAADARAAGISEESIAEILRLLKPIPDAKVTVACSEGRHFSPDYPDGCCTGRKLTDDYEWVRCECPAGCHDGQEVKLS